MLVPISRVFRHIILLRFVIHRPQCGFHDHWTLPSFSDSKRNNPLLNLQWVCLILAKTGQLKNVLLFDFKPSPFQGAFFWLLLHIIFNNFHCFYKIGSNKHLINYVISVEVCKVLCVLVSCLYSLSWDVLPHGNVKTTQYTNRPTKQLWPIHEKRTTTTYNRERILCSVKYSNTTTIKVAPKTAIKVTQLATISGEEDRLTR